MHLLSGCRTLLRWRGCSVIAAVGLAGVVLPGLAAAELPAPTGVMASSAVPPTPPPLTLLRPDAPASTPAVVPVPAAPLTPFERNLQRVFANDNEADIRVVFGYDNSADIRHVNDPFRAEHFMDYLKKAGYKPVEPTEEKREQLGVTADARNLRLFEGLGTNGRRLNIAMIWSARTTSFARNIGAEYLEQVKYSEEALKFMQKAASEAEVMLYVGHSREGGGPDTFPPEIKPDGVKYLHRVDYTPYRNTRPGLASLSSSLSKSKDKPYIVSWASCKSDVHFAGWFKKVLAQKEHDTSLIMSTRFTTFHPWIAEIADNDEGLMATVCLLEAFQFNPSQEAFERRLKLCEIEAERISGKPAWRVSSVPAAVPAPASTAPTTVAEK
ncbi:hypothetical protein [Verrucomicrobium sp. BvORR106]|uniref:hypothetical protein n=1 Tax=Verrucomicrobium sp. BvORR106 TaxID=1403819 RepID=UPI00056DEE6F|nr:hypothetical protein [Verrucomicrobium sp. BvORR106]